MSNGMDISGISAGQNAKVNYKNDEKYKAAAQYLSIFDTNNDGILSADEEKEYGNTFLEELESFDLDDDGILSDGEIECMFFTSGTPHEVPTLGTVYNFKDPTPEELQAIKNFLQDGYGAEVAEIVETSETEESSSTSSTSGSTSTIEGANETVDNAAQVNEEATVVSTKTEDTYSDYRPSGTKETIEYSDGSTVEINRNLDGKETSRLTVDAAGNATWIGSSIVYSGGESSDHVTVYNYSDYDIDKHEGQLESLAEYEQSYVSDVEFLLESAKIDEVSIHYDSDGVKTGSTSIEYNDDGTITQTEKSYDAATNTWTTVGTSDLSTEEVSATSGETSTAVIPTSVNYTSDSPEDIALYLSQAVDDINGDYNLTEQQKAEQLTAILDQIPDQKLHEVMVNYSAAPGNEVGDFLNDFEKAMYTYDKNGDREWLDKWDDRALDFYNACIGTGSPDEIFAFMEELNNSDIDFATGDNKTNWKKWGLGRFLTKMLTEQNPDASEVAASSITQNTSPEDVLTLLKFANTTNARAGLEGKMNRAEDLMISLLPSYVSTAQSLYPEDAATIQMIANELQILQGRQ